MINKTAKRLLSASRLGINFDYGNGHRWINFYEEDVTDNIGMHEMLERQKISPAHKINGNIIDCLNYVDYLLGMMGRKTLEHQFDEFQDWGFGESTNWEESGTESDEIFYDRTKTLK